MSLLKELHETEDLSVLPQDTISDIEKMIRDGAKNVAEEWANAMELVHKAYEVTQTERPTPDMSGAWKQYEEMLTFAVKELTKTRGLGGDWRMSSHIFHEAAPSTDPHKYIITSDVEDLPLSGEVTADSVDDIIGPMMKFNITGHELEVKHRSEHHCCVYFCKNGKRTGHKMTIKRKPEPPQPKK